MSDTKHSKKRLDARLLKRILHDAFWPFLVSVIWTAYSVYAEPEKSTLKGLQAFMSAFFVAAWFGNNIGRVAKRLEDDDRHDKVIRELTAAATDVAGYAAGGDSYCHHFHLDINANRIVGASFLLKGKFPLYDCVLEIRDPARFNLPTGRYARDFIMESYGKALLFRWQSNKALITGIAFEITLDIELDSMKRNRFVFHWYARNGHWVETVELLWTGTEWARGAIVQRVQSVVSEAVPFQPQPILFKDFSENFPRKGDGSPDVDWGMPAAAVS